MARKDALFNMRQILIKRRDALRNALAGDLSLLKELRPRQPATWWTPLWTRPRTRSVRSLAEVESRELARIENALERMRNGQYGLCEACAIKIPLARLNALPYATYCIECQREAERSGGGLGGDADWGRLIDSGGGDAEVSINDIELDVS